MNYYVAIPNHDKYFSTAPGVSHTGAVMEDLASFPTGQSQTLDIQEFSSTIGAMSIKLTNKDCAISKYIYQANQSETQMFYREKAEIYGFDANGYYKLFAGIITKAKPNADETMFNLTISDFQNELTKPLFAREFSSFSSETEEDINNRFPTGFEISSYIDDDGYTQRKIVFSGHPIDFVLGSFKILYYDIESDGTINYLGDSYTSFVDEINLLEIKTKLGSITFYFEFFEKIEDPFNFFRNQIYKATGCYPVIKKDGKFKLKLHEQPTLEEVQNLENNSSIVLNEDNIIEVLDNNGSDASGIINHIEVHYQYDFSKGKYMKKRYFYNTPSVIKNKKFLPDEPLVIELMGINSMDDTAQLIFITNLKDRYFTRFSDCSKVIKLAVFYEDNSLEAGTYVTLTNSKICEWKTGKVGERGISGVDIDDPDSVINLNVGDEWGGFLDAATPGVFDGNTILVVEKEIKIEFFQSILTHHASLDSFINKHGY